ncbi:unnamed protein product [Closterium sp. NIES-64]|nr:unnamed protein product [Closterium sp. NIES-64]
MHSRFLVSGLPRVLPPLPPSLAPPCLPCVEGQQRAAPHSSSFPPIEAPLQTLQLDVWGPARVRSQGHKRYFLLVVNDYTRYTTVFPLRTKGEVPDVLIPWIRAARLQLCQRFQSDFPVLRLHSDRGGEFSSDLLAAYCAEHGIRQTFTLRASPQQNGVVERRIGLVMEVARTSMIHAASPHFLWPFAVQYAAHQLNLWPRVSVPETSPTLRWTGEVGDASVFRVDPVEPVEVAVDSGPTRGTECAEPGGAGSGGTETGGAEPGGTETGGAGPGGAESLGAEPGGVETGGAVTGGAETRGAEPGGAPSSQQLRECYSQRYSLRRGAAGAGEFAGVGAGGLAGAVPEPEPPSPQRLREWYARRCSLKSGAPSVEVLPTGGSADTSSAGGAAGAAGGSGAAGGTAGAGGGPRAVGGAAGAGSAGVSGAVSAPSGGASRPRPYFVPLLQQVLGGLTERREPESRPVSPVSRPVSPARATRTGRRGQRERPPPVPGTHFMTLRPSTAPQRVPLPSPPESSLPVLADPESDSLHAAKPTVTRLLATAVTDPSFESAAASALVAELVDFAAHCRLDYAASLVAESESVCPPSAGGECALGTDVLEDTQEDLECLAAAAPHLLSMLIAPEGDPDAPDIPTPRSYAEAIAGEYSSQWQSAMDAEMAS